MKNEEKPLETAAETVQSSAPAVNETAENPRLITCNKRETILAVFSLISAALLIVIGVWGAMRIGFSIAFLALFLTGSIYLYDKNKKPGLYGIICSTLSVSLTSVFILTENKTVKFFSAVIMAALVIIWFSSLAGKRIPDGDTGILSAVIPPVFKSIGYSPDCLKALFSGDGKRRKTVIQIMTGLACSVPLLAVVISLLIRSDDAFGSLAGKVFVNFGERAVQTILVIFLAPLIFSLILTLKQLERKETTVKSEKKLPVAALAAFLSAMSISYVTYLFSQLAYFFDSFSGILPEGYRFSYAEYARKGFFELCAIAAINFTVVFVTVLLSRRGRLPKIIAALDLFICLFTVILTATVMAKIVMYIKEYGMTVLRIGTGAFMVLMFAVFVALILRCFTPKAKVLQTALVSAGIILLILGAGNIDSFIAEYNYNAYKTGKLEKIDAGYMLELGDSGVPYLAALADDKNCEEKAKEKLAKFITANYSGTYSESDDGKAEYFVPTVRNEKRFRALSVPKYRAYSAADKVLKEHPDLLKYTARANEKYHFPSSYPEEYVENPKYAGLWVTAGGDEVVYDSLYLCNGEMSVNRNGIETEGFYFEDGNILKAGYTDTDGNEIEFQIEYSEAEDLIYTYFDDETVIWERM